MKVLLTGANGMLGRSIVHTCQKTGKHLSLLTPSRAELNLLDEAAVFRYLESHRPDAVIHAAAIVGGIEANRKANSRFLEENLRLNLNVISCSKRAGVKEVLNIASSCMYPKNHEGILKEEDLLKGKLEPTNEGYALAKIAATKLCSFLTTESGEDLRFKTVVPCNLYGPFDKFDSERAHLVPSVIRKVFEATKNGHMEVEIWGDGEARREFMFVDDLALFIVEFIDKLSVVPDIVNVGLGQDYSVNEYYRVVADAIGFKGRFVHDLTKPTGMKQKLMSSELARSLGWSPCFSLSEGIRKTIAFYSETYL